MSSNPQGLESPLVPQRSGRFGLLKRHRVRRAFGRLLIFAAVVVAVSLVFVGLNAVGNINRGSVRAPDDGPIPVPQPTASSSTGVAGPFDPLDAGVPDGMFLKPVYHDLK